MVLSNFLYRLASFWTRVGGPGNLCQSAQDKKDDDKKDDENDNMDKSKMAALCASEALFGFDCASPTSCGVGEGIGGEPKDSPLSLLTAAQLENSVELARLDAMRISGLHGLGGNIAGFTHRVNKILQYPKFQGSGLSTSLKRGLSIPRTALAVWPI
jgi:hypothetical protein